ncbi:hypothetical protein MATL_G00017720 [Megalops atlanticus]|uniref:Interferon-induced protein with tetratricopeptide repeats 5 n=1 Tax=Megalops atlanticus TaxID=7932 RepID=A0A9D3QII8_MEGAT|nr:hypothetical protein MATL_G00017720 [Megalops atlanticus]
MSLTQDTMLKTKLLQLDCHFTWGLKKDDTDFSDLQNRLKYQIELGLGEDTGIARSFSYLAFTKYLQGLLEEARDDLVKAEESVRKHHADDCEKLLIVTYGNFAWIYYYMRDWAKSQSYLEKVEEIKRKFPTESRSVLHPVVYGEKGWTFLKFSRKYYEKARECFKKALEAEPEESEWNIGYAIALHRTESELTSIEESPAVKQLRRALELDSENADIMALLALRLAAYKKFKEAEELVEKAMKTSPDNPYVTRYVAKFFRQQGSTEKSIALLKRGLEQIPSSAFLHHQLALCYKRKRIALRRPGGHTSKADTDELLSLVIHHLEEAAFLKPSFIYAMAELGLSYGENGNIRKAEEVFQRAFEVATAKNESLQVVNVRYADFQLYHNKSESLAMKHYKEGLTLQKDTAEGKKCANKLETIAIKRISRNSQDGEAFGILGYVHQTRGEKRQAIECYEKALLRDPGNEEYLSALCDLRLSLDI